MSTSNGTLNNAQAHAIATVQRASTLAGVYGVNGWKGHGDVMRIRPVIPFTLPTKATQAEIDAFTEALHKKIREWSNCGSEVTQAFLPPCSGLYSYWSQAIKNGFGGYLCHTCRRRVAKRLYEEFYRKCSGQDPSFFHYLFRSRFGPITRTYTTSHLGAPRESCSKE